MPLPLCSQILPVPIQWPRVAWIHRVQSWYYNAFSGLRPLTALAYSQGFTLRFDGCFWWINSQAYELVYFAKGPWWYVCFSHSATGTRESFRILFSQLSAQDQWQLNLLFELYQP